MGGLRTKVAGAVKAGFAPSRADDGTHSRTRLRKTSYAGATAPVVTGSGLCKPTTSSTVAPLAQ